MKSKDSGHKQKFYLVTRVLLATSLVHTTISLGHVAFPQFSTHSIMSKLDWSGRNEENKIHG